MSDARLPGCVLPVVLSLVLVLLAGCGFKPRGQALASGQLGEVYVEASGTSIGEELRLFLHDAGVARAESAEKADVVVRLGGESYERRVLTVDAETGRAREFVLEYRVSYGARTREGGVLIENQQLLLKRDFVFDDDAVIGKSREADTLRDEMRRDAVLQILGRLDRAMGG